MEVNNHVPAEPEAREEIEHRQQLRQAVIGNRVFLLLFCLLMVDSALAGFGVDYLPYPSRVIVIIAACMVLYLVSISMQKFTMPLRHKLPGPILLMAMFAILSGILGLLLYNFALPSEATLMLAQVLLIASIVGLVCLLIFLLVRFASENKQRDQRKE